MMKFMVTGMEPRGEWAQLDDVEMNRRVRQHQQMLDDLATARARSGPSGLIFATTGLGEEHEVITVKCEHGRHACLDGPFPETKEVVGGFDLVEFASRQDAVEWATAVQRHPTHVSEIRPIQEFWWMSGIVDRVRLFKTERWSEAPQPIPRDGTGAAHVFMFTSVEDERALLRLPESERKQIRRAQQGVAAEYIRQRSVREHEPGMWVRIRLSPSAEATTIRWTGGRPVASDGPAVATEEVVTGVNLVACASQDEAIAWAQKLAARDGAAIEIRPARGSWWVYHE